MARNCSGSSHGGAHQVCTSQGALPALEITVGGGGAALARVQAVFVHAQAHGAARLAPFKTGLRKNLVQAFLLGLTTYQTRAGDDQGLQHRAGHTFAFDHGCGAAQVLNTGVGTGTDEHPVYGDACQRLAGLQSHIVQGALGISLFARGSG